MTSVTIDASRAGGTGTLVIAYLDPYPRGQPWPVTPLKRRRIICAWAPCCSEHRGACPMCRRPWDAPGDADGEECWICWRLCSLEVRP